MRGMLSTFIAGSRVKVLIARQDTNHAKLGSKLD